MNTRFSLTLFQQLHAQAPDRNLFISPAGVSLALALALNGARGETREAILGALGLAGLTVEEANRACGDLAALGLAGPGSGVDLCIANSIWHAAGCELNPVFAETARTHYGSLVSAIDFADPGAAALINRWVSERTRGKIPTVLDQVDPLDRICLINAIYFNGRWQRPFEREDTRPEPFHLPGGSVKQVPMMSRFGWFDYLDGDGFQAAALPYRGGPVRMYLILPADGVSLRQFAAGLTPERWDAHMAALAWKEGLLSMPRVKLNCRVDLQNALSALGMSIAFNPARADFGGLFTARQERIGLSAILQSTCLDVNETGTEAAAATEIGLCYAARPSTNPFRMVLDRPYLMAIRDSRTGSILFLGAINNP